eukprot:scaffold5012_cov25-Tisochrysis_lutea.AAC.4
MTRLERTVEWAVFRASLRSRRFIDYGASSIQIIESGVLLRSALGGIHHSALVSPCSSRWIQGDRPAHPQRARLGFAGLPRKSTSSKALCFDCADDPGQVGPLRYFRQICAAASLPWWRRLHCQRAQRRQARVRPQSAMRADLAQHEVRPSAPIRL